MNGYYELKSAVNGKSMFNLRAGNHEVILTSETYESKAGAQNGIASVQANGQQAGAFERKISVKGEPFFVLKATNGQIIGRSEMYTSEGARDNGILSVIRNSPSPKIVEAQL